MKPFAQSDSTCKTKLPHLRSAVCYIAAGLLFLGSYQLGKKLGGGTEPSHTDGTHAPASEANNTRNRFKELWKHLEAESATGIDFRKLCHIAIQEESISTEPDSALSFLVSQLTFEQAESVFLNIDYSIDKTTRENATFLLQNRLVEINPERAIQIALDLPGSARKVDLLTLGFNKLASRNTETALVLAGSLDDPGYRYVAKQQILVAISERSPEEALAFASREDLNFPNGISEAMMQRWVANDLDAACQAVLHLKTDTTSPTRSRLFDAVSEHLLETDPDRVISIWEKLREIDPRMATSRARALIENLSKTDHRAALDFMLANYPVLGMKLLTSSPFSSWFDDNPEAAFTWLQELDNKTVKYELINDLRANTLQTLPTEQLFTLINALPPSERDQDFLKSFYKVVEERDFPMVLKWINLQGNDSARSYAKRIYLEMNRQLDAAKMDAVIENFGMDPNTYFVTAQAMKWAKQDPEASLEWIHRQRGRGIYPDLIGKYGEHLASADPSQALVWIQQVADPAISQRHMNRAVRELMKAQPEQSLSLIQAQLQGDELNQALFTYLRHFPSRNPQHALAALRALDDRTQLRQHYTGLLDNFSADEAIALAQSMPDEPALYTSAIQVVASRGQFQKAIELLNSPHLSNSSKAQIAWLQATIAEKWAKNDKHAAVEWALSLPALEGENKALNRALYEVCFYEGDTRFAQNIIESIPREDIKNAAITEIYKTLINRDAEKTYEWVARHGNETNVKQVVARATEVMLRQDSVRASKWVLSLPEGAQRDIGADKIIDSLVDTSPEEAFPWALSLKDERASQSQLRRVVNSWKRVAPEDAYRAVRYARELSEGEKQQLLEMFQ